MFKAVNPVRNIRQFDDSANDILDFNNFTELPYFLTHYKRCNIAERVR